MNTSSTPLPSPRSTMRASDKPLLATTEQEFEEAVKNFRAPMPREQHDRLMEQQLIEDGWLLDPEKFNWGGLLEFFFGLAFGGAMVAGWIAIAVIAATAHSNGLGGFVAIYSVAVAVWFGVSFFGPGRWWRKVSDNERMMYPEGKPWSPPV